MAELGRLETWRKNARNSSNNKKNEKEMIKQETIDRVLQASDIKDVVSEFVQQPDGRSGLVRKGVNWWACCPFHTEKTPSFCVTPGKGTWHCFGSCQEGGDAIRFVEKKLGLTFPEAVKWLGEKYGIPVEDEEETQEMHESRMKRETLLAAMKVAHDYFRRRYHAKEGEGARAYAKTRWGAAFSEDAELGYAPEGWDGLKKHVEGLGLNAENFVEVGLLKRSEKSGGLYDALRGRLVIPVRTKIGELIAFTARDLTEDGKQAKYVNSPLSAIYSKSASIYGLHTAWRQAAKEGRFYVVEGASDAMKLHGIGVWNAVAPLGTAQTQEQLGMLRKTAYQLCYLPDADVPKDGEPYGTGIRTVMKNGRAAIVEGFSVSVKEIPLGERGEKQDAGSWCTTMERFKMLDEEDFVTWYAKKLLPESQKMTTEAKGNAVTEVADLLSYVTDETKVRMYIDELDGLVHGKGLWKDAVAEAKRKRQAGKKKKSDDEDLLEKYGFKADGHQYYGMMKDGGMWAWSNFELEPLFHIKDAINPKRLYKLTNYRGESQIVEFKQAELESSVAFSTKVGGLGDYVWEATMKELNKLKRYLYAKTRSAREIVQLGWQKQDEFFAFGNGVMHQHQFVTADDEGIVDLGEKGCFYLPAMSKIYAGDAGLFQFERKFVHRQYHAISLKEWTAQVFRVFGRNGKVAVAFAMSVLYRDVIVREVKFPLINFFGPPSTGKTELAMTIMSLFGIPDRTSLENCTKASVSDPIARVSNALVFLDEYKNDVKPEIIGLLKDVWDNSGRSRMNMDKDKKKETLATDSGVILCGQQMPNQDNALFSRLIFLGFSKTTFTEAEKREYNKMKDIRMKGATHLLFQLLDLRPRVSVELREAYRETNRELREAYGGETEDASRILDNWCVILAIYRIICGSLLIDMDYQELKDICLDGIREQNAKSRKSSEIGNFWEVVQYLFSDGQFYNNGDFKIKTLEKLKTKENTYEWTQPRRVLFMQKSRVFTLYAKTAKTTDSRNIPKDSLEYYLVNSPEYYGEYYISERFEKVVNGVQAIEFDDITNRSRKLYVHNRAICFDYDALVNRFGISLGVDGGEATEPGGNAPGTGAAGGNAPGTVA